MTPPVLRLLLDGELSTAARLLGAPIADGLDIPRQALELRLQQFENDPGIQPWLIRAIVLRDRPLVIGDIGSHLDEIDGPEDIFERSFAPPGPSPASPVEAP